MNDGLPGYPDAVDRSAPPRGPIHDDSTLLYADPAEMEDYFAALDANGSLRCAHETPRHLDCGDCAVEDAR